MAVELHDHHIAINYRRRSRAPFDFMSSEPSSAKNPQITLPDQLSLQVIDVQPFCAHKRGDIFPIGHRRLVGLRRLGVSFRSRDSLMSGALPKDFAALFVQA